jgi:uncharacterized protein YjbJ (UPF0337 family)
MNWDRVQGNWKQFTGKVKEQWGQLRLCQGQTEKGCRRLAEPVVSL